MNLIINSQFKPFSYQELLAPVAQATQMHNQTDAAITELQAKAAEIEHFLKSEQDPTTYNRYKGFYDKLQNMSDDLAMNGLNPQSMRNIMRMKIDYNQQILPMQMAIQKKMKEVEEQKQILLKDPTMYMTYNAMDTPLEQYINNPNNTYKAQSLQAITSGAEKMIGHLARSMESNPEQWRTILGGAYFERLQQTGFKREDILEVLKNQYESGNQALIQTLNQMKQDLYNTMEFSKWSEEEVSKIMPHADSSFNKATWAAIGQDTSKILNNVDYAGRAKRRSSKEDETTYTSHTPRLDTKLIGSMDKYSEEEIKHFTTARIAVQNLENIFTAGRLADETDTDVLKKPEEYIKILDKDSRKVGVSGNPLISRRVEDWNNFKDTYNRLKEDGETYRQFYNRMKETINSITDLTTFTTSIRPINSKQDKVAILNIMQHSASPILAVRPATGKDGNYWQVYEGDDYEGGLWNSNSNQLGKDIVSESLGIIQEKGFVAPNRGERTMDIISQSVSPYKVKTVDKDGNVLSEKEMLVFKVRTNMEDHLGEKEEFIAVDPGYESLSFSKSQSYLRAVQNLQDTNNYIENLIRNKKEVTKESLDYILGSIEKVVGRDITQKLLSKFEGFTIKDFSKLYYLTKDLQDHMIRMADTENALIYSEWKTKDLKFDPTSKQVSTSDQN